MLKPDTEAFKRILHHTLDVGRRTRSEVGARQPNEQQPARRSQQVSALLYESTWLGFIVAAMTFFCNTSFHIP